MNNFTFVSAYFSNEDKTTIMSFWEDPENQGVLIENIIEADEQDSSYANLLEHITLDEIHSNTWEYIKESEQAFKDQVIHIAKEKGWLVNIDDGGSNDFLKIVIDMIFDTYDEKKDKEQLFYLKLQLFEKQAVKECKDKELKKALRRASTPLGAIRAAIDIVDAIQEAS
jgi:hypothetical protein